MQKFSFREQKDMLFPETLNMVFPKDKNGNNLTGEEFIKKMANIVNKWEEKYNMPVPIQEQKFVAWLKQTKNFMDNGMSFEDVLKKTVVFM